MAHLNEIAIQFVECLERSRGFTGKARRRHDGTP